MHFGLTGTIAGAGKFLPWNLSNNVAHYEADLNLSESGGSVSSWSDTKGRGFSFGPASGTATATYVANDGDGKPSVTFNGTQGIENTTWGAMSLGSDFTMAAVVQHNTPGSDSIYICLGDHADGLGRLILRPAGNTLEVGLFSSTSQNTDNTVGTQLTGSYQTVWVRRSGGSFFVHQDGNAEQSASVPSGSFTAVKLFIGFARAAGGIALPFNGRIRAMTFFQRSLSSTEMGAIRTFWKAKWPGLP